MAFKEVGNVAFASVLYSEPSALGLFTNVLSAFIVAMLNFVHGSYSGYEAQVLAGAHLIAIGGFLQLIAGVLSFRRNDHLSGTAFVTFASLWTSQGALKILSGYYDQEIIQNASTAGIVGFILVAGILFGAGLIVNYVMPPVLVAMFLSLIFELVGLYYSWGLYVAGAFEMIIVIFGIYGACAAMFRGITQRYVWPGFGNAPVNVLLIKSKGKDTKKGEKKNTKYAEPMALGYIGNVLPACILAFYGFGYTTNFEIAMVWLLPAIFCQLMASYYAFLRNDMFHAVNFAIYLVIWVGLTGSEFLFSPTNPFAFSERSYSVFGIWTSIILVLCLIAVSLTVDFISLSTNISLLVSLVFAFEYIPEESRGYTFAVASCLVVATSFYAALASLFNSIAEKPVIPIGGEIVSHEKMERFLKTATCKNNESEESTYPSNTENSTNNTPEATLFCLLAIASLFGATVDVSDGYASIPWILTSGCLLLVYTARCAFATKSLQVSASIFIWALFWLAYAFIVVMGADFAENIRFLAAVLLGCSIFVTVSSVNRNKVWLLLSCLMAVNTIGFELKVLDKYPEYMNTVTMILTGLVSLYGGCSHLLNNSVRSRIFPLGKPIVQTKKPESELNNISNTPSYPLYDSSKTSGLMAIAKKLDEGGLVGVPTDTVYALAGLCKHPASIERIYKVKDRPAEKPICLCLSNIDQLKDIKTPFSPLLWQFMKNCYPGGITCVVPKGEWLQYLGVGNAAQYVGTPNSVAIRVPDHGPLAHLIDMTGPIAITSANPSGEPDSTHHSMVADRLGHKIDGLLCDGPSNEEVASTVVNCMKIDQGEISFFRIGCVPKEIVLDVFEKTKASMSNIV